jgi:nitroreductase/NAD-dependent dihydropyrimidine dehydrogenase PreA subunit
VQWERINYLEENVRKIWVDKTRCTRCQKCARECFLDIITATSGDLPQINDPSKCIGCGHCVAVCPSGALMHSDFAYSELLKAQPDVICADDAETMLSSRRSYRAYKPDLPARGDIERMLRVATMAPSAVNCEDRGFVVITDPNVLNTLRNCLVHVTKRNVRLLSRLTAKPLSFLLPRKQVEHFERMIFGFERTLFHVENGQDLFLHDAPVLVLFTSTSQDAFGKDHALLAMSYFMTQAQAMGYGTCVIGHVQSAHKRVAQHVKIKKSHRIFGAMTLGRPKTVYRRTVSRKAADVRWVEDESQDTRRQM